MLATEGARQQDMLDLMQRTTPEKVHLNLNDYDKLINTYALLNSYQSKAAERETDPEQAAARDLMAKDFLSTYDNALKGNMPKGVQNALMTAGLEDQAATGTKLAPGSRGVATVQNFYGRGANDYINQVRGMLSDYLTRNPQRSAGLDPGSAAQMRLQETTDNANLENQFRQQNLGATVAANNNMSTLRGNIAQAMAAQSAASGANRSAGMGSMIGALTSLAGAGAVAY